MQEASKGITGSVVITDQSLKLFALLPFSLHIYTSPCVGVHTVHQSPQHFDGLRITCAVLLDVVLHRQTS